MANREIFSKHIKSNVKLATRYDAEGREVQVERREDVDALAKEQETFDILIKAGYYRACIKGLSSFDKVVGGMTWCIECCDYDVDVDLLFHENLTIGQKISLVEKIVAVLPQMKCPYRIEPHQIQGLEFLSIYPVIEWLVKRSVENRSERILRLKSFAVGQFYNNFQFQSDRQHLERLRTASKTIKHIQEIYQPERQYQCKDMCREMDERTKVQLTILEYRNESMANGTETPIKQINSTVENDTTANDKIEEIDFEKLREQLISIATVPTSDVNHGDSMASSSFSSTWTREALNQHYQDFKREIDVDVRQLTEQTQMKALEATRLTLEKKLQENLKDNEELAKKIADEEKRLQAEESKLQVLQEEMRVCQKIEEQTDPELFKKIKELLQKHDQLKREESQYKEKCRNDLEKLQENIEELERYNSQNPEEQELTIQRLKEKMQKLKLQVAKSNRAVVIVERQLDDIPDRTELAQYQRRFHELYSEMSAKHHETKQYFSLYNTLNDKKCYMEKEVSLLDSISEAYNKCMSGSREGREEFQMEMETILNNVQQTLTKVRAKYEEERLLRDKLTVELQTFVDVQREYASAIKEFTKECQKSEELQQQLQILRGAKSPPATPLSPKVEDKSSSNEVKTASPDSSKVATD